VRDEIPLSPPMYDDPDAAIERRSGPDAIDALKAAIARVTAAVEAARKPGMPLSVLSNVAREAPLGSLFLAFLVGVAVGRRSR